jgi:hypothetical protein
MTKSIKIITHDENSESTDSIYNEDEFILCRKPNGEITSCGFSVNSALLREGKPIMSGLMPMLRGIAKHRHEDHDEEGDMDHDGHGEEKDMIYPGNVSDMFTNLSIPAGIFYMQQKTPPCKQSNMYEEEELNETLFDKLLALASESEKRKRKNGTGTRKVGIVLVAGAIKANKTKKIQKDKPTKA